MEYPSSCQRDAYLTFVERGVVAIDPDVSVQLTPQPSISAVLSNARSFGIGIHDHGMFREALCLNAALLYSVCQIRLHNVKK